MKQKIIIYDLDGVIVDSRTRSLKYIDLEAQAKGDYPALIASLQKWGETTEDDVLIESGHRLVLGLMMAGMPDKVIALTSRGENGRMPTLNWLHNNTLLPIKSDWLFMRQYESEGLSSVEFKKNVIQKLMDKYDIMYLIDDQPEIVDMYRSLGLPAIHFLLRDFDCRMGIHKFNPK